MCMASVSYTACMCNHVLSFVIFIYICYFDLRYNFREEAVHALCFEISEDELKDGLKGPATQR